MKALLISEVWMEAIAWTLVHALWQCGLIAALLWILLKMMRGASAHWQYLTSLAAFTICACWVSLTLWQQYESGLASTTTVMPIEFDLALLEKMSLYRLDGASQNWESVWLNFKMKFAPYLPTLFYTWLIGIAILGVRLLGGLGYVSHILKQSASPTNERWILLINQLTERMDISREVCLKVSEKIGEPLAIGYLKPVILFPIGLLSGLSPAQIEAILIHELAHIRRADYWVNLFQNLVETILFFHPAIWWISSQVRKTREDCCDDWVVEMGSNPAIYAKALLDIHSFNQLPKTHLAMSATGKKGHLTQRIHRLFTSSVTQTNAFQRSAWAVFLLCMGSLSVAFQVNKPTEIQNLLTPENTIVSQYEPIEEAPNTMTEYVSSDQQEMIVENESPVESAQISHEEMQEVIENQKDIKLNSIQIDSTPILGAIQPDQFTTRLDTPVKKLILRNPEKGDTEITLSNEQPLYVVNGEKLERGTTLELDPNDIATIDVLKGESAAAVYGDEGNNGVIVIVTKEWAKKHRKEMKEKEMKREAKEAKMTKEKAEKAEKGKTFEITEGTTVKIRPTSPQSVAYFIDGVPIEALGIKATDIDAKLPADKVESIEVLKGESLKAKGITNVDGAVYIYTKGKLFAPRLGREQALEALSLNVYPNPAKGVMNVEVNSSDNAKVTVLVMNAQGQLVTQLLNGPLKANEQKNLRWETQAHPAGTYYVYVVKDGTATSTPVQVAK